MGTSPVVANLPSHHCGLCKKRHPLTRVTLIPKNFVFIKGGYYYVWATINGFSVDLGGSRLRVFVDMNAKTYPLRYSAKVEVVNFFPSLKLEAHSDVLMNTCKARLPAPVESPLMRLLKNKAIQKLR